ncbi:MAG TPA: hypothetical protein O0X19_04760 [Methanocorpusculum sp.]|nr:hypothetical protein [Candidatus Methanocorpusculum equi]HJJ33670.1 hypothetical protein [Methanocorpusculum sp.]HJJ44455.1 hypothetical protein [Methanocorpusculum sp.]HJJ58888.1 hypothetical protein [Methanocorpusculum sp.]HJJ60099.1 hypothetical protein [Methanocorpusculum sp.]
MSKYEPLWKYVIETCGEELVLSFEEIERITGFPIDHAFLQYKKELTLRGFAVKKISMKEKSVRFVRCG